MPPKRTAECSLPVAECNWSPSPDPDPLVRRNEHFVTRLNFKGVVPDVSVSSGTNHAKLTRRMRVAYDLLFDVIVADFSAPCLRPSEKHALIARVSIEHRRRLSLE